jgi:hypothetical protein
LEVLAGREWYSFGLSANNHSNSLRLRTPGPGRHAQSGIARRQRKAGRSGSPLLPQLRSPHADPAGVGRGVKKKGVRDKRAMRVKSPLRCRRKANGVPRSGSAIAYEVPSCFCYSVFKELASCYGRCLGIRIYRYRPGQFRTSRADFFSFLGDHKALGEKRGGAHLVYQSGKA